MQAERGAGAGVDPWRGVGVDPERGAVVSALIRNEVRVRAYPCTEYTE